MTKTVTNYDQKFTMVSREYEEYRRNSERKMEDMDRKIQQLTAEI